MKIQKVRMSPTLLALVAGAGGGMLLALPFSAPLMGAVLPDAAATLWGAALGAGIAVVGAMWAAQSVERRKRQDAVALIVAMVEPIAFLLDELAYVYGEPSTPHPTDTDQEPDVLHPADWQQVKSSAAHLLGRIDLLAKRTHRIDAVLALLGVEALEAYFSFETELEAVVETIKIVEDTASEPGVRLYPQHPRRSLRFVLAVHNRHIAEYLEKLRLAGR